MLGALGVENVCAGAADRYPEVDLDDVRARRPDRARASEPYPFRDRHLAEPEEVVPPLVDGQDLFRWGM